MKPGPILFLLLLLGACARSEDASIVVDSNELQAVEQVRTPEDDDGEVALGEWRQTLQDENDALEFGPMGTAPLFSLRCDGRRNVLIQLHGADAAGDLPVMLVSIGSETRRLAVTNAGGSVPMLRASVAENDPLIDTLAGAETPITIRVGDTLPLVLPADEAIPSFLERCRTGASQPRLPTPDNGIEANDANPAPPSGDAG